ncbi:MAG: hypothetical protein GX051_05120 [Clostridiales bacterium]|nr:hypothetical protein [Clostridiales bacterium]
MLDGFFNGKSFKGFLVSLYAAIFMFLQLLNPSVGVVDTPEKPDDFIPIMRFIIASDVHLDDNGNLDERDRLAAMIREGYELAQADPDYTKLDAVCFAGDITNSGTESTFQIFKQICDENIREGTLLLPMLGNHDFKTLKENTRDVFSKYFSYGPDFDVSINGVHIIGTSKGGDGSVRGADGMAWFAKAVSDAAAENPEFPVFVIQHEHPFNTVYGSINWGDVELLPVLSSTSQVIDFSGHSHYPINDPRSIWQGAYTAFGTATLSYFEMEVNGIPGGQFPEGNRNAAQFYVVETAADGETRVRGYDLLAHEYLVDYFITPSNRQSFAYNTENRIAQSENPEFASDAQLVVNKTDGGETLLNFPAATDDLIVHTYRLKVVEAVMGIAVYEDFKLSDYYYTPMPTEYSVNIGALEGGKRYIASVIAEDAYGMQSEALRAEFTA